MKPITYDLRGNKNTSDQFYHDLSHYVDILLGKLDDTIAEDILDYHQWIGKQAIETSRSREEYYFDFLMTGVLWNEYISWARRLSVLEYKTLHFLYRLRRRYRRIKPAIDRVRGILATLFLRKRRSVLKHSTGVDLSAFRQLIRWLQASGDFREEAIRLSRVKSYLATLDEEHSQSILRRMLGHATQFKSDSLHYFQEYTGNVNAYVTQYAASKRWQENVIFCTRREVEYLMNVVGAEIMNRAMAEEFAGTQRKYALLPACMRQKPEQCQAKQLSLDMVCTGCDTQCNIYKFREVGRREGFAIRIIPHSSDFSRWLQSWAAGRDIGVIGVACPLHLIAGGLELRKLNIDAQCVFLDYCGCKTHWSEEGVMTDMNVNQLLNVVGAQRQELAA